MLFPAGPASAIEVKLGKDDKGHFVLLREGQPYFIRGAGGADHLTLLKEHGGNSIRTWGIETLEQKVDGKRLIDRCAELGLTISTGIYVGHERHGFNYSNPAQIQRQRENVRAAVRKYKDHPAVLVWGLGNEMEGPTSDGRDPRIWKELNELAAIVKAEDPTHPVMTVIAGAVPSKVQGILEHYPNLDILGVNAYAGAGGAAAAVKAAGWKKPFVLAEFGPSGHWEVPKTKWGAPIEPSSREKAAGYFAMQRTMIEDAADISLGSYCFVWGQKQETTSTWYGMFLKSGEKLPQVDAMCRAWTDKWPANRCPKVTRLESELKEAVFPPGQLCTVRAEATDPEGDPLTWQWTVTAESTDTKVGGDKESEPPSFPDAVVRAEKDQVVLRTPTKPGNYRVFAIVRDGKGGASAENFCFRVEGR
ncbi:MAG: hypothetical protein EBS05_26840 [Proteobacteria bacterium]|nr:hypothetical protein [Pseudomonadota bacterium]